MADVLIWWPVTKHLVEFTKQHKDKNNIVVFDGVDIYGGTKGTSKNYPCMEFTFDQEKNINIYYAKDGKIFIWVDILIENDSDDPEEAYVLLYQYQLNFLNMLKEWNEKIKKDLSIALRIIDAQVISDGDVQRPTCSSRIVVEMEWRNSI